MKNNFRSGFITIIGRPNVGKSTLLNKLVGQKVAIVSYKPQTTRNKILGIVNANKAQIVLIDTPGIHRSKVKLNQRMVNTAFDTLKDIDLILFMVDLTEPQEEQYIIKKISKVKTESFLLINKIDRIKKIELLPIIERYRNIYHFTEIIPISALKGNNLDTLLSQIIKRLPYGPRYFPEDTVTDQPERFIMGELIREKIIHLTSQEIPYAVHVNVERMHEDKKKSVLFMETIIYVERDSQKGIIIGKSGQRLKKIGILSRREMEGLLGIKIYLDLRVKVKENWRKCDKALDVLGYRGKGQ